MAMADGGAAVAEIEMVRVDIVDGAGAHPSPLPPLDEALAQLKRLRASAAGDSALPWRGVGAKADVLGEWQRIRHTTWPWRHSIHDVPRVVLPAVPCRVASTVPRVAARTGGGPSPQPPAVVLQSTRYCTVGLAA